MRSAFFRGVPWVHVRLDGPEKGVRRIRELGEDRLAPDHDQLALVGDRRGSANDVLKSGAIHIAAGLLVVLLGSAAPQTNCTDAAAQLSHSPRGGAHPAEAPAL